MPDENRSLLRGVQILKAFRPGSDLLGNGELAERTGLSRATVSRLTGTLVSAGMLERDSQQRAYRLAAPVLSLAFAMKSGSPLLQVAAPMMREASDNLKLNVGLAVADGDEMVYLESIRYNRKVALRNVVAGQRVPVELTSLGHAWLAVAPEYVRKKLLADFKARRLKAWPVIAAEIQAAIRSVAAVGYCVASWQPEVVAVSTPLQVGGRSACILNMSMATDQDMGVAAREIAPPLLALKTSLETKLAAISWAT